ncbi:MAG: universal stress protein [Dehalococcoidales bacterium]|nr:universal stress protein [Dehalococcoidales bacterium]
MFERIVVPLDGSRLSAQAVPFAGEMGKRFDAEVILVRVISPSGLTIVPQATGMESAIATDIIAQEARVKDVDNAANAKRYLTNWAQALKAQGIKASYQVTMGVPAKAIMELVDAQKASLIVMMSHGRGWFKRAIMGSVADEILRGSTVPVLIIRAQDLENK